MGMMRTSCAIVEALGECHHRVMCRNIRVLHNFEPPVTPDEIAAAALQYVRKVSGVAKPTGEDLVAFDASVAAITASTSTLLRSLRPRPVVRTREGEREKAKERWSRREEKIAERAIRR